MKRVPTIAAVLLALALSACATVPTGQGSAGPGSAGAGGVPGTADTKTAVAQATVKAAQYDYDGALALLASDNSADATKAKADIGQAKDAAQPWTEPSKVPHLFWHPLVIDPQRAFHSPDVPRIDRAGNAQYMVTQKEFAAQLQSIYDKGYVLVHPERLYALDGSGAMEPATEPIRLPAGKKPLVISEDDANYYGRWDNAGFPRQLKIAADGTVVNTYQDAQGQWSEGAYDVITVVDAFVREHPDFSYRGDKGSIAVTGYEGVLGYRSSAKKYGASDTTKQAAADAKKVADALKADGWHFACHTWNHISYQASTPAQIAADMDLWKAEVGSIVGPTDELIYAFGSDVQFGIGKTYAPTDPKYKLLKDAGFNYFFPIDNTSPYYAQVKDGYYRQWRVNIDGITMQKVLDGKPSALPLFFDTKALWDPDRPKPTPKDATGVS